MAAAANVRRCPRGPAGRGRRPRVRPRRPAGALQRRLRGRAAEVLCAQLLVGAQPPPCPCFAWPARARSVSLLLTSPTTRRSPRVSTMCPSGQPEPLHARPAPLRRPPRRPPAAAQAPRPDWPLCVTTPDGERSRAPQRPSAELPAGSSLVFSGGDPAASSSRAAACRAARGAPRERVDDLVASLRQDSPPWRGVGSGKGLRSAPASPSEGASAQAKRQLPLAPASVALRQLARPGPVRLGPLGQPGPDSPPVGRGRGRRGRPQQPRRRVWHRSSCNR